MDYTSPDYPAILAERGKFLLRLRSHPEELAAVKTHYKYAPWDFIRDWGMTFEPRNVELGLPANIPFIPWARQIEFLQWLFERWRNGERGLVEKTRDAGATWLSVALDCTLFIFWPGYTAGYGSRKEELVDKKGDPKCIMEKARTFLAQVPDLFRPSYDDSYLKIINKDNGATITGEAGDNIGRGARMSRYTVDEAAFLERQEMVDAALSQTTNSQIDVSTPNGSGNAFYKKRHGNSIPVFVMDWKDDPRKDDAWYAKQKREQDAVTVAQEIDRDYNASVENIFIPSKWVQAAVDAHVKLGFEPVGAKVTSFDPADTGDAKAMLYRHGVVILDSKQITEGDVRDCIEPVKQFVGRRSDLFSYDADGMGAPIVKLAIEDEMEARNVPVIPFRGSGKVKRPHERNEALDKTNNDAFGNYRAQRYYELRERFERTYNAVVRGEYSDPSTLISISKDLPDLFDLCAELSRPLRVYKGNGQILVESKIDMKKRGVASPNLADCANMLWEDPPAVEAQTFHVPDRRTAFG